MSDIVDQGRLFARLNQLFDLGPMSDLTVLVVGCGSGGGSVALQLVMSGITNLILVDKDDLELENVIRHVCDLRFLGQKKVVALETLLKDRNPHLQITGHAIDVLRGSKVQELIAGADVVVLATDNDPTRWRVNELCVEVEKPYCVARVFTRGIGGEVFAYRPGEGGCLGCLETVLQRTQLREGVREVDLITEEDRNELYGLGISEVKDSPGLNVDISFITAFHTRFVLDAMARLLPERPKYLSVIQENYLVWGNRAVKPFDRNFQIQRITLAPQESCLICGGGDA